MWISPSPVVAVTLPLLAITLSLTDISPAPVVRDTFPSLDATRLSTVIIPFPVFRAASCPDAMLAPICMFPFPVVKAVPCPDATLAPICMLPSPVLTLTLPSLAVREFFTKTCPVLLVTATSLAACIPCVTTMALSAVMLTSPFPASPALALMPFLYRTTVASSPTFVSVTFPLTGEPTVARMPVTGISLSVNSGALTVQSLSPLAVMLTLPSIAL